MAKIILVQSNYQIQRKTGGWGINPPIGLCYLASVLNQERIPVKIIDANLLNLSEAQAVKVISAENPDIVGISFLTPAHEYATKLARLLPKNILKVAGGNQATALPETVLKEGFDVVVRGEGEKTFLEIVSGKNLKNILSISYKEKSKVIHNTDRPPLDPNLLPFPARHLLISDGVDWPYQSANSRYTPWTPIFTSRGCPYNCYYCFKKTFGYQFRPRSPENVLNELIFLKKKYGILEVDFYDDCFNYDLDRAEEILDGIIYNKLNLCIRFSNGLRADKINYKIIKKMKKAGCIYIAYGVESGDETILSKIPKNETLYDIEKAVRLTKEAGIDVCGFFIYGLIGDTKETMQKTLNFSKKMPFDNVSITTCTPYPGTKMYQMIKEKGKLLFKNWRNFHHTAGKMMFLYPGTADERTVITYYKRAWTEFYFRPGFIIRQILKIRDIERLKLMIRGFFYIFKARKNVKLKK